MNFDVYEYTNQGGRSYNEDSTSYALRNGNGLFVVADGLGGHSHGEIASSTICKTLIDDWNGGFGDDVTEWITDEIEKVNKQILDIQEEKNETLKSTVVALAIEDGKATWANVGDSRLYYFHKGKLSSYTNDHSVAFKKFKAGEISRASLATDEDQSSLLRSIGGADRYEPEIYGKGLPVEEGDAFFLCSDGAWEYITDEEILVDLMKSDDAKDWAEYSLQRIIERVDGTNDNLSILTVMIPYSSMDKMIEENLREVKSTVNRANKNTAHAGKKAVSIEGLEPVVNPYETEINLVGDDKTETVTVPADDSSQKVDAKESKSLKTTLIVVIVLLLALIGGLVAFIVLNKGNDRNKSDATNTDAVLGPGDEDTSVVIPEIEVPEIDGDTTEKPSGGILGPNAKDSEKSDEDTSVEDEIEGILDLPDNN